MGSLIRTMTGVVGSQAIAHLARVQHEASAAPKKVGRRLFTRNAALGGVVLYGGLVSVGAVRFLWPNKTGDFGKTLTVPRSSVPDVDGQPYVDSAGKFYLIHTQDGVLALYWKCVHLGCTVPPFNMAAQQFQCPCHGSIYNYEGERIGGPAPRPLDYMSASITNTGDIAVNTGAINQRERYEASQTTPLT